MLTLRQFCFLTGDVDCLFLDLTGERVSPRCSRDTARDTRRGPSLSFTGVLLLGAAPTATLLGEDNRTRSLAFGLLARLGGVMDGLLLRLGLLFRFGDCDDLLLRLELLPFLGDLDLRR